MLTHPTLDKLESLRLHGMIQALKQQWQQPEINELSFEQRLGLLVDRETDLRQTRQMHSYTAASDRGKSIVKTQRKSPGQSGLPVLRQTYPIRAGR